MSVIFFFIFLFIFSFIFAFFFRGFWEKGILGAQARDSPKKDFFLGEALVWGAQARDSPNLGRVFLSEPFSSLFKGLFLGESRYWGNSSELSQRLCNFHRENCIVSGIFRDFWPKWIKVLCFGIFILFSSFPKKVESSLFWWVGIYPRDLCISGKCTSLGDNFKRELSARGVLFLIFKKSTKKNTPRASKIFGENFIFLYKNLQAVTRFVTRENLLGHGVFFYKTFAYAKTSATRSFSFIFFFIRKFAAQQIKAHGPWWATFS